MFHMVYFLSLQTNIIFLEWKMYLYYCKTLLYLDFIYLYDNLFTIYLTVIYIMQICELLILRLPVLVWIRCEIQLCQWQECLY